MFRSPREVLSRTPAKIINESDINTDVYNCDYCSDGGWGSETELEIHNTANHHRKIKRFISKNYHYCGTCYKKFNNNIALLKHIKVDHLYSSENSYRVEREIYICYKCNQLFFNKQHLIIHMARHKSIKRSSKLQCPCCRRNKNYFTIYSHLYSLQSTITCKICFLKCKNRIKLHKHLKTHQLLLKCEMCDYPTNCRNILNKHIKIYHKIDKTLTNEDVEIEQYFAPKHCNVMGNGEIIFATKGFFISNNVKICILCREICLGYDSMKQHILLEHNTKCVDVKTMEQIFEYRCSCGEVFNNKVLLKHHVFKLKGDHKFSV